MRPIVGQTNRGALVFKDSKGYYVDQRDVKGDLIRHKYLKNFKPRKDYPIGCIVWKNLKLCSTKKRSKKSSRKTRRK
jgi:hypothetical protein